MFGDTIAAISTAWGDGGIAVVRMSGPDSWTIAERRTRLRAPEIRCRFAHNGSLLDEAGEVIDEILVLFFRGPHSYTGEDLVEFHCHGGSLLARRCLELLLADGARQALPGEFTRRAFELGRIDLSQAEAVGALIQARSNEALRAASRTLRGDLTRAVKEILEELTGLAAEVEVGLDFPEEDVPYLTDQDLQGRIEVARGSLADLLDRCSSGLVLREGIRVALVGRPNAGKSSLLNALLKESRAIVTALPGTTRDIIEEVLTYRGVPLRLVDTAGIGEEPADEVEAIGIERARRAMEEADILVWVIDGSCPLTQSDQAMMYQIAAHPYVIALNKSDLPAAVTPEDLLELLPDSSVISISAQKNSRLEELKDSIVGLVSDLGAIDAGLNASERQIGEIRQAMTSLAAGAEALSSGLDQSLAASCIAEARAALERLLGDQSDQSLLHAIFSRFCIGK